MKSLKISSDIDGVIANFFDPYLDRFGIPKKDSDITKNVVKILSKDKDFWLSLPVLHKPTFKVQQFTTARSIPKSWIREYLSIIGIENVPIYQLYCYRFSKVPKIKMGGCNLHIDDSLSVFIDCNLHGIPCLLMDNPANQEWGPIGRIYSLDKDEIEDSYYLFKQTMFPYFKELL